jgi:hypothetical protein
MRRWSAMVGLGQVLGDVAALVPVHRWISAS